MIISGHELCRTRLCRATDCPNDAEPYSRLCWQCERRPMVRIHTPPTTSEPTLWCGACRRDKPDHEFQMRPGNGSGRPSRRRGRFWCCRDCQAKGKNR